MTISTKYRAGYKSKRSKLYHSTFAGILNGLPFRQQHFVHHIVRTITLYTTNLIMRPFYSFATLAFLAVAHGADYQTVQGDIADIKTRLGELEADAKGIESGSFGIARALKVEDDSVQVHKLLLKTLKDTNASPPFEDHSIDVGGDFLNMQPKIDSVLEMITEKKDNLKELSVVVLASLYQLKQDTDILGKAVVDKLSDDFQQVAPQVVKEIIDSFNKAIAAYGGKSKPATRLNGSGH